MGEETGNTKIVYLYDAEGTPIGMQYHGATYAENVWDVFWFEKNLQGDIVAVYNQSGTKLISYTYDAWGNFITTYHNGTSSSSIAAKNPFTYRGYYYDSDLSLYYLNTRYYDSIAGRFVSADNSNVLGASPDQLTDKNLYAYCDNNPVMRSDNGGEFWNIFAGAIIGFAGQLASDLVVSAIDGELSISHWTNYLGAAVGGAIGGLIPNSAGVLGDVVGAIVSTVAGAASYNIESAILGREDYYSFEQVCYDSFNNVLDAAASSYLFGESKLGKFVKSKYGKDNWRGDLLEAIGAGSFNAVPNSEDFRWPNTHFWESPEPERWYPLA